MVTAGDRIGRYTLLELLGQGSGGRVFRARADDASEDVAIKFLEGWTDVAPARRFRREVKILRRLQTPRVVRYLDDDLDHEPPYLVMELLDGTSLSQVIQETARQRVLEPDEILLVSLDVLAGLAAAHRETIIHRDLKPSNVILDGQGRAVLIDFGLARIEGSSSGGCTRSGEFVGTVAYASPDQLNGWEVSERSDLYQWGLIVAELTLAHRLEDLLEFRAQLRSRLERSVPAPAAPDPRLRSLMTAVARCLELRPKDRPESAGSLLEWFAGSTTSGGERPVSSGIVTATGTGTPARIAGYDVVGTLGEGGMGRVLEGRHPRTGERVAIKVIKEGHARHPEALDRFLAEMRILSGFLSPRIVRLLDSGVQDSCPYLVMEYLPGVSLQARLRAKGPYEIEEGLGLFLKLCEGIAELHARNILHRDIKPTNVMLVSGSEPKLLDLGLVRDLDSTRATATGMLLGTLGYMAPEMIQDGISTKAGDVYQMGLLFREMIAGKPGHTADDPSADLRDRLTAAGPDTAERRVLIEGVVRLVDRAVVRDPARRIADGRLLLEEVRALVDPGARRSERMSQDTAMGRPSRRDFSDHSDPDLARTLHGGAPPPRPARPGMGAIFNRAFTYAVVAALLLAGIAVALLIPELARRVSQ